MMDDHIILIGAEDVQQAGNRMKEAAAEMTRAANLIWEAQVQFHQDVDRLEYMNSPAGRVERRG